MIKGIETRYITQTALCTALITVCSWISIPFAVPFTLQTAAVCLTAAVFGRKKGIFAILAYILLGAFGVPVFAGFKGGFMALFGPTGGFIMGFVPMAFVIGYAAEKYGRSPRVLLPAMAAGSLICYITGTLWFMLIYTKNYGSISLTGALSMCVFPYMIPDAVKAVLAAFLAGRLSSNMP